MLARGVSAPSPGTLQVEDPHGYLHDWRRSAIEAAVAEFLEQTGEEGMKLPRFVLAEQGSYPAVGLSGPAPIDPGRLRLTVRRQLCKAWDQQHLYASWRLALVHQPSALLRQVRDRPLVPAAFLQTCIDGPEDDFAQQAIEEVCGTERVSPLRRAWQEALFVQAREEQHPWEILPAQRIERQFHPWSIDKGLKVGARWTIDGLFVWTSMEAWLRGACVVQSNATETSKPPRRAIWFAPNEDGTPLEKLDLSPVPGAGLPAPAWNHLRRLGGRVVLSHEVELDGRLLEQLTFTLLSPVGMKGEPLTLGPLPDYGFRRKGSRVQLIRLGDGAIIGERRLRLKDGALLFEEIPIRPPKPKVSKPDKPALLSTRRVGRAGKRRVLAVEQPAIDRLLLDLPREKGVRFIIANERTRRAWVPSSACGEPAPAEAEVLDTWGEDSTLGFVRTGDGGIQVEILHLD